MTAEFLGEKAETCTPDTVRTLLATLKKLQEGLYALNWIREDIVPAEWQVSGRNPPRGPYASDEAKVLQQWVETQDAEYGQALRFILSSGALGFAEAEARRELAIWLGHNPHRTEVTYAYVPKSRQA